MMRSRVILAVLTGSLLVFIQGCSVAPEHAGSGSLSSVSFGKGCDAGVRKVYFETYYKVFRTNCVSCHAQGGESGRFFASDDFDTAFKTFKTIGRTTVELKALNAGHKPPHTGPQHQPMIIAANPKWVQAEAEEADCSGGTQVNTTGKSNSAIFTGSTTGNIGWNRVTFNMRTDVKAAPSSGPIMMEISIEVRRYKAANGMLMGYEFRNPRGKILDDGNPGTALPTYRVKGISVLVNDSMMTAFTLFGGVDYTVTQTTDELLAPGLGFSYVLHGIANSDTFGLRIDSIADGNGTVGNNVGPGQGSGTTAPVVLPTKVTFADLNSSNQLTGVFNNHCVSCHSGAGAPKGLDLKDYNLAVAAAGQADAMRNILMRMNNANNPMPPSGMVSSDKRKVVEIWITGGTPQN